MLEERHLGYPVIDDGEIEGIVTLEDLEGVEDPEETVGSILTPEVITIDGDEPASGAFQGITQNEIGRLVVTDSAGDVAGIITRTDVMNAIKVVTNLPRS